MTRVVASNLQISSLDAEMKPSQFPRKLLVYHYEGSQSSKWFQRLHCRLTNSAASFRSFKSLVYDLQYSLTDLVFLFVFPSTSFINVFNWNVLNLIFTVSIGGNTIQSFVNLVYSPASNLTLKGFVCQRHYKSLYFNGYRKEDANAFELLLVSTLEFFSIFF